MTEKLLLTVTETASLIGLGRSSTYALIRRGALKSVKIGGSRRVARCDVEAFVEQLRADATVEDL
jgi:excisionase family DNA binding protein